MNKSLALTARNTRAIRATSQNGKPFEFQELEVTEM